MDGWLDGQTNRWTDKLVRKYTYEQMDKQVDGPNNEEKK